MSISQLLGRRWPIYLGGFLLGLAAVTLLLTAKRRFAPKFQDKQDERSTLVIGVGKPLRLRFEGEPEKRLVPGFQSALYLARQDGERWKPVLKLDYEQLLPKENLLGPWTEQGNYEIRMALYICREPGAPDCLRRLVVQPFRVIERGDGAELSVNLNAELP